MKKLIVTAAGMMVVMLLTAGCTTQKAEQKPTEQKQTEQKPATGKEQPKKGPVGC